MNTDPIIMMGSRVSPEADISAFFSFFPLAISTRVVYNYLHMAG